MLLAGRVLRPLGRDDGSRSVSDVVEIRSPSCELDLVVEVFDGGDVVCTYVRR